MQWAPPSCQCTHKPISPKSGPFALRPEGHNRRGRPGHFPPPAVAVTASAPHWASMFLDGRRGFYRSLSSELVALQNLRPGACSRPLPGRAPSSGTAHLVRTLLAFQPPFLRPPHWGHRLEGGKGTPPWCARVSSAEKRGRPAARDLPCAQHGKFPVRDLGLRSSFTQSNGAPAARRVPVPPARRAHPSARSPRLREPAEAGEGAQAPGSSPQPRSQRTLLRGSGRAGGAGSFLMEPGFPTQLFSSVTTPTSDTSFCSTHSGGGKGYSPPVPTPRCLQCPGEGSSASQQSPVP